MFPKRFQLFFPRKKSLHSQGHPSFPKRGVSAPNQCQRNDESAPALKDALKDYDIGKEGKKF